MRILIITNLYPNRYQPQRATYNRQHFRALAKQHAIKIVAPISWVDELRNRVRGEGRLARRQCCQLDGIEVVHPRYYYSPGVLRSCYGYFFLKSIRSYVLEIAKDFRPDILLASWSYPDGYAAVRLAREMRVPAVVKVLGSDVNLLDRYPARQRKTWNTLQSADAVVTVSQDLADKVVDQGIDTRKVSVVYRGIDRAIFKPGSQRDAQDALQICGASPMLLFIGNLVPVKAVDTLIAACSQLAALYPQMQCHIIGGGPLRNQLQAQAGSRSLGRFVRFHGVIEHSQLTTWYRAADLVVLPSLAEGVPNVLIEAIACARPYVASKTGGIPEISKHAGCVLVNPGDPQTLADAIREQLQKATTPHPSDLPMQNWDESARMLGQVLENCRRTTS